jgi:uncharacterized membrane protein
VFVQMAAYVVAIAIASYLSWEKHHNTVPLCTKNGGCAQALFSSWGSIGGIALTDIGLVTAVILLVLTPFPGFLVRLVGLTAAVTGALFTIYLRYVEQADLNGRICVWCVSFAACWWVATLCELRRTVPMLREGDTVSSDANLEH